MNKRCICPKGHMFSMGTKIGDSCGYECTCGLICGEKLQSWADGIKCEPCECYILDQMENGYQNDYFSLNMNHQQQVGNHCYFTCDNCDETIQLGSNNIIHKCPNIDTKKCSLHNPCNPCCAML